MNERGPNGPLSFASERDPEGRCPEGETPEQSATFENQDGCAAKTWATAPALKAVVLIGSIVSGAVKSCSPEPRTTGWTTRRYSSIKPVSTSDRANRTPP